MTNIDVHLTPRFGPSWVQKLLRFFGLGKGAWGDPGRSVAFTTAFVSLAAKMAKADGVAVSEEAEAFERFLDVEESSLADVRRVYEQAKQDTAGYEDYADRIGRMLQNDPDTRRRVFECLFYVACSDGILHPAEDQFLNEVARRFGLDAATYRAIRATFVHDAESPYAVLDVAPDASDNEVKRRYRQLVRDCHPDRLIAEGAPAAVVKAATAKVAAYNAAYEQIESERKRDKS